jgi:hypothetical protein
MLVPSETTEKIDCSNSVQGQRLCTEYGYRMGLADQLASSFEFRIDYWSKHLTQCGLMEVNLLVLKDMLGFILCHATVLLWCALQDSVLQIPCRTWSFWSSVLCQYIRKHSASHPDWTTASQLCHSTGPTMTITSNSLTHKSSPNCTVWTRSSGKQLRLSYNQTRWRVTIVWS